MSRRDPRPGTPHPNPVPPGPNAPRYVLGYPWQLWLLAFSPGIAAVVGLAGGWLLTAVVL